MPTIWKYHLAITDVQSLALPKGARIIFIAEQIGQVNCWAWVPDPNAEKKTVLIGCSGTGGPAPDFTDATHLGSVVTEGGRFVWHFFQKND